MTTSKPWYLSKTIWAALVSVAATIAALLGVPIDSATREGLANGLLQAISAMAGLFAIFGRLTASSKIQ